MSKTKTRPQFPPNNNWNYGHNQKSLVSKYRQLKNGKCVHEHWEKERMKMKQKRGKICIGQFVYIESKAIKQFGRFETVHAQVAGQCVDVHRYFLDGVKHTDIKVDVCWTSQPSHVPARCEIPLIEDAVTVKLYHSSERFLQENFDKLL